MLWLTCPVGWARLCCWLPWGGMSYEEVAIRQGVAVGTVKSRVSRARHHLALLLDMENRHEIEPDQVMQAALQAP